MPFYRIIILIIIFIFHYNSIQGQDQRIADSLISYYKQNNKTLSDTQSFKVLSEIAYNHNIPDSSLSYSYILLDLAKKNQNDLWSCKAYLNIGHCQRQKGLLDGALQTFFENATIAKKIENTELIGRTYLSIADVYSISKNYNNSIVYYNKAIKILREQNDSILLAKALLNAGSEYLLLRNFDTALIILKESEEIFKAKNYTLGIAYSKGNIGRILSNKGQYNKAINEISLSITLLEDLRDYYGIASYKITLARIYQDNKDFSNAIKLGEESLNISLKNGLLVISMDATEILSKIYQETSDFENAYNYHCQYITFRDSINNDETIRKMADLRTEFEVAQKQTIIDILKKKNYFQQLVAIILSLLILLVSAFAFVIFRNFRRKREINIILSEQKEELETQRDMLESVNNTKDRFFSIISHDLRGPIGVLNGTTMLIREYLESKDYNQLEELTKNMEYSVKKVQYLLDNLLEWALCQQGQFEYHPENLNINFLIEEVIGIFDGMAKSKNIVISYTPLKGNPVVTADKNSLMTIIRNLLNNALKFTQKFGSIFILSELVDSHLVISIQDSGIGIHEEKLGTIFKISEKKSTWGTENEKGLGLGLSLVHDFVNLNHGYIEVESQIGVGTTFTIFFPQDKELNKILLPQDV